MLLSIILLLFALIKPGKPSKLTMELKDPTLTFSFRPMSETFQGTVIHRTKLITDLFTGYNKVVVPDGLKVKFGMALIDLHPREASKALDLQVRLRYVWTDNRLRWVPEDYGGANVVRLPSDYFWQPDITLYNSADEVNRITCWNTQALLFSNGEILFIPPCRMSVRCNLTLSQDPFGEQHCSLRFSSWVYDGESLVLDFYNNMKGMDLEDFYPMSPGFRVSTTGERQVVDYSCCPEPYTNLIFNVTFSKVNVNQRDSFEK